MTELKDARLVDLLPAILRDDERASAAAAALQPWIARLATAGPRGQLFLNLDTLSSLELDHLAWQFSADVWRDTWPLGVKRATLQSIIEYKRLKGTRWAVERAVEHLGGSVEIVEWWQTSPKGPHNTFDVIVSINDIPGQLSSDMQRDLRAAIEAAKPAREVFTITLSAAASATAGFYGTARPLVYVKLHATAENSGPIIPVNPVIIVSPADGSTVRGGVVVAGTADPSIELTVNGEPVTASPSGAWTITLPLPLGLHTITATDGFTTSSVTVTVAPVVQIEILFPSDGATFLGDPTLFGTAAPSSMITVGGDPVVVGAGGNWTHTVVLASGVHTIVATDGVTSDSVTVTVVKAPVVPLPIELDAAIWLDPTDASTLFVDAEGTIPATIGDPIGLWKNKGWMRAAGNAAQPVSASRPVWDGANVVFDGLGSLMRTTYTPTLPQSVFMFARRTGPPPAGGVNRIISTAISLPYVQIQGTSAGINAEWNGGSVLRYAQNTNGRSNGIIGGEWSAGRFRSYIGDTVAANDAQAPTNFTAAGPWAINTNGSVAYECGDVFIFDRILTDQDRAQLLAWMEARQ